MLMKLTVKGEAYHYDPLIRPTVTPRELEFLEAMGYKRCGGGGGGGRGTISLGLRRVRDY